MRKLTPSDVNAARSLVTWTLRVAAIILLAWGAYLVIKRLVFAIVQGGSIVGWLETYTDVGNQDPFACGLAMLLVGTALAILSRRIARWIVTPPEAGCPRCGYAGAVTDTCPECGQDGMTR